MKCNRTLINMTKLPAGIPLRPTRGLVEFQKWMLRLAERKTNFENNAAKKTGSTSNASSSAKTTVWIAN
jgi:hypothetical protein